MPWKPLLMGPRADDARATIFRIADRLHDTELANPSLVGTSGAALFYLHLGRAVPDRGFQAIGETLLDQAVTRAFDSPLSEGLFAGISGVGWALAHARSMAGEPEDADDPNSELDDALSEALAPSPWSGRYDLISGLVGIGLYSLERLPSPVAQRSLHHVIDRLGELAHVRDDGLCWWSDPRFLAEDARRRFPEGNYDLGVAHGIAGVIAFLGRVCAIPAPPPRARELFDGAVRWLLRQQLDGGAHQFPGVAGQPREARSAWCYGAPGIAIALFVAARSVGDGGLEAIALDVARTAASRPPEECGVVDAGLCHGAAGLGHIFNRLHQATGDELLAETARHWFARAVHDGPPEHDTNFLTGATGVALALLGSIVDLDPSWDRILLCSGAHDE